MLSTKAVVYDAPAIADRVAVFHNTLKPPVVVVEHFDGSALNSVQLKYQESDDGTNWTDIASTPVTINPGGSDLQVVSSSRSRLALHAGGGVKIKVTLIRQVDGAPFDFGVAYGG